MPTKRTRRTRAMVPGGVSEVRLHLWSDGLFPMPPGGEDELIAAKYFGEELPGTWEDCRDAIISAWTDKYPGTRPSMWWSLDAPEKSRRRLGGIGDPWGEYLGGNGVSYHLGIPTIFINTFEEAWYNGRARDVNGKLIVSSYREGDFAGRAIDPKKPPAYESEASYLKRHGLLTPAESRRLRPNDFEPEVVLIDDEEKKNRGNGKGDMTASSRSTRFCRT